MPALESKAMVTLEEYNQFPDDWRVEVFEGQMYNFASPSQIHQTISMELSTLFHTYLKHKKGSCKVFHAPFDVKLSEKPLTMVQPDLFIVCDKSKLDGNRCNGAPDFIIEIVSPGNPLDDYVRKLYYYEKYGVREYWIVDPQRRTVAVNYFEGQLINVTYSFHATIKVNIYDDLMVDFSEIEKEL